ncbi:DNA-binding MarR family transcriptional regulator [Paenibacillus sp. DS2015]|uniref:MarR family transcriptional regulator n=1 Tax=Paenibacillus sp. DS2015 TaxID=3373917 RepID=UPI003D1DF349
MTVEELVEIFDRVVNKYIANDKKPNYYGTDILLHASEVHTIDVIGKHEDVNITQLAKYQGVTKGAVSQMINKLCKKELVNKEASPQTENEVVLNLTLKGRVVYESHLEYHRLFYKRLSIMIEKLPADSIRIFNNMICELEAVLDERV